MNIRYNLLNLPDTLKEGNTVKATYSYLADGTKVGVLNTANNTGYESKYCTTDHLGSIRLITNSSGAVDEYNDYYPFGLNQNQNTGYPTFPDNRYKFSGKELQTIAHESFNYLDFGARMYDPVLGRWSSVDPLAERYYNTSPYAYVLNNPIKYFDPNGMSTHTDLFGKVVAVYNDNDLRVYRHDNLSGSYATYEGQTETYIDEDGNEQTREMTRLSGGEAMGETYYWDEFRGYDNKTGEVTNRVSGHIMFGEHWDSDIITLNTRATKLGLPNTASSSTGGGYYDIKTKSKYAPYLGETGKMLGGKYVSARSAGNFLAGMNGATGRWGYTNASYISMERYLRIAGALHSAENGTKRVAPYYGEIPYAGRMIVAGFVAGMKRR